MSYSVPYNYRCPNPECLAEYVAVQRPYAFQRKPRCIECGTPFLAMENSLHIHYEAAWPVTRVPPDDLLLDPHGPFEGHCFN